MNERIHVGQGLYDGRGLTLFPVWLESEPISGYCWKPKHIAVSELNGGASVNNLTVTNTGSRPHIVLEGDIFEGGMQNRVLTRSMVLAHGESREVPVACVEEGRWNGATQHRAGRRRAPMGVRYAMSRTFSRTDHIDFDEANAGTQVQGQVWDRIRQHEMQMGATQAHSLIESMDRMEGAYTQVGLNSGSDLRMLPGQRGVLIGIGGHIASAEFFGHSDGLKSRWDALLSAARYEALDAPVSRTPSWAARDFARALELTPFGEDLAKPEEFVTPVGPLALSSFSIALGLVHAAVYNGAHPVLAGV
jgi:hypothetical protein